MSEREEPGVKCCNCKKVIPGCSRQRDWGYKLGKNMYFCTYGCMREKEADIKRKAAETVAKRKARKALEKAKAKEAEKVEEQKMEAVTEEATVEEARTVVDSVEEVPGVKLVRMEELTAVQARFREVQEQHQQLMEKIKEQETRLNEYEILKNEYTRLSAELGNARAELAATVQDRDRCFRRAQQECNEKNELQKRLSDIDHGFNREQAEHELMAMSENISALKERQMCLVSAIGALAEVITG